MYVCGLSYLGPERVQKPDSINLQDRVYSPFGSLKILEHIV